MSLYACCGFYKVIPYKNNSKVFFISINSDNTQGKGETEAGQMFWLKVTRPGKKPELSKPITLVYIPFGF